MVKLRVYKDEDAEKEKEIFLKLKEAENGVTVVVVDENGNECDGGLLVRFTGTGTLRLFRGINPEFGFSLDQFKRLELTEL